MLFDNIELFLIFAGNQLGKLKVVVVVVVMMVVGMFDYDDITATAALPPSSSTSRIAMLPGPLFFVAYFRPKFRCENALHVVGSALRCSRCPLRP